MTWLAAAKKRNQRLGAISYDTGQNVPRGIDLRNTGYAERLRLTQTATFSYATAGPTGLDALGQYGGIINRATLMANSVGLLGDCTGATWAFISALDDAYNTGVGPLQPIPTSVVSSPGTSPTTDTWLYDIPVALQLINKPTPIGFFQTALNAQETRLELRFNPIVAVAGAPGTGIYTGNGGNNVQANNSGSVDIQQIYFDPIADPQSQPTLAWLSQWREWQSNLTADGTNEIILPPSNYYSRLILTVVTGGAGALALDSTHVTKLQVLYGANLAPYDEPYSAVLGRMSIENTLTSTPTGSQSLPLGVYLIDLLGPSHTERDVFNSAATTNLRIGLVTSGATYSGGAYVKVAAQQLIPLTVAAPGTPMVQGTAA